MKKTIYAVLLGMTVIFGVGCSKKSGTTASTTVALQYGYVNGSCYNYSNGTYVANNFCANSATTQYTYSNGMCYQTSTNQQVDPSLCNNNNNNSNNGYVYNNGYCYSTTTGQYVNPSYCTNTGNGTGNGNGYAGYQQCYGTYVYMNYGQQQYVTCNGSNCRGYTLYQPSTGQPVYCQ